MYNSLYPILIFLLLAYDVSHAQVGLKGSVIKGQIQSLILKENLIGLDPSRNVHVYLPPQYQKGNDEYPVVYYLHSIFSDPMREFKNFQMLEQMEYGFEEQIIQPFILVAADFTGPTSGSWYENSTTSGRWRDFILEELVPFVEQEYRVSKSADKRAIIGFFAGGRGAIQMAMVHPDVFGSVYAMHPVATGTGYLPLKHVDVDWEKMHMATSYKDIAHLGRTPVFLSICQAFLPNPERPPFYCDFLLEYVDSSLMLIPKNIQKERRLFHMDEWLDDHVDNLMQLQGIALDWGRFDVTQAHVISNRRFSKLLTDLGVPHEGEEFAGDPWSHYGGVNGRITSRVLPFLNKHLFKN